MNDIKEKIERIAIRIELLRKRNPTANMNIIRKLEREIRNLKNS